MVAAKVKHNSVATVRETISSIRAESKLDVSRLLTAAAVQTCSFNSGSCRQARLHLQPTPRELSRRVRNVGELGLRDAAEETKNKNKAWLLANHFQSGDAHKASPDCFISHKKAHKSQMNKAVD